MCSKACSSRCCNPSSVQDILDLGLAGIALSRFSGLWIALKTTAETAEQAATLVVPSTRSFVTPDFALPPHGLNYDPRLRFPAERAELERRVVQERIPAALAWARANRLDRRMFGSDDAPIGIVTVGRAHADAMHALRMLDLEGHAQIALYKVAMTWPLETEGLRAFARGKRAHPGGRGEAQLRRIADPRRAVPPARRSASGGSWQDRPPPVRRCCRR